MEIKPEDLEVSVLTRSGFSFKPDSKVRVTHIPSRLVVTSDKSKSQHANKQDCLDQLKLALIEHENNEFMRLREEQQMLDSLKPRPVKYYIGETVVVYDTWLGTVTCIEDKGIWAKPLVNKTPKGQHNAFTHSCYATHNVTKYKG